MVTAARPLRTERTSSTRETILTAAERLYAEHGVFAVSNRQVSEAAGQGNNAAVGYHFGTKTDLVRAIEQRHREPIEQIRERLVARTDEHTDLRGWVECLVRPLTDHLADLGNPTWYARFAAQAMADPAYHGIVVRDALSSASLVQVIEGINRCLPELPAEVRYERNIMARNLLMHSCADRERALNTGSMPVVRTWSAAGGGLIDAIVGLWLAPVTGGPA
ncbi:MULTISPECIES: TetR/AcrR family transcriptional regulator [Mycolicibacterium]|uniref:TetR family transcriptional regulator n=1 Tax=Mycolicibacterium neoaurum TaxID=1795 RepID=A0AAV2WQV5_MYCNE|nr:TetR/AcrR family transcriptional regulator [Mycolicibacterium neoaurum]TLH50658.1 TetR/AcrR family transcriptional regulator [Mycolicibacterium neoaurum]CDQ46552.1 TetR family transcriptional regulator [Mycolicibacterium neoaurum]